MGRNSPKVSEAAKVSAGIKVDKYRDFQSLQKAERSDAFHISATDRETSACIIAPHGGGIEPGTSELAAAVAGEKFSLYLFEGKKISSNRDLHITSTNFDEPAGVKLVERSRYCIAFHGCQGGGETAFIGGRNMALKATMAEKLLANGFTVATHENPELQGESRANICNRGYSGEGVQFELSWGLRQRLTDPTHHSSAPSRESFVAAIRKSIAEYDEKGPSA